MAVRLEVNGVQRQIAALDPNTTLLQALRGPLGLTGTKEGCAEGDCGACTVLVRDVGAAGGPAWRAVNACLIPAAAMHGQAVRTVEGLGRHVVQEEVTARLGSQCGYCTPGFVMSIAEACHRGDLDAPWKQADQLSGNLCRCTGYRPLREALAAVAGTRPDDVLARSVGEGEPLGAVEHEGGGRRFVRPVDWDGLWAAMGEPGAVLVAGGTDLGLEITKHHKRFDVLVSLEGVSALRGIAVDGARVRIGATTRIAELEAWADRHLVPVARMLRWFGGRPIKNRGTVGGNLMTASPIGDLAPVLLALGADVVLRGPRGERRVALSSFFLGYRKIDRWPDEVLAAVELTLPHPDDRVSAYKVTKRREMDISAVSAGLFVRTAHGVVVEARLAFGGVAATPLRVTAAEDALRGGPWTAERVEAAARVLEAAITPMSDHRGSADYRRLVAGNLLRGFFAETQTVGQPRLAEHATSPVGGAA